MPKMVLSQGFKNSANRWCPAGLGDPGSAPKWRGDLGKALILSSAKSGGG